MMLQRDPIIDDRLQSNMRLVGLTLIAGGLSAAALARQAAHWRRRWQELSSSVWMDGGTPGSNLVIAGVALLDASDALRGHPRPR